MVDTCMVYIFDTHLESFNIFQIVANDRNGIDVDKMDYFTRDGHGLGIKSTFDHNRYIGQCRVMFKHDKPNETTIAVRDKVRQVNAKPLPSGF